MADKPGMLERLLNKIITKEYPDGRGGTITADPPFVPMDSLHAVQGKNRADDLLQRYPWYVGHHQFEAGANPESAVQGVQGFADSMSPDAARVLIGIARSQKQNQTAPGRRNKARLMPEG